MENKPIHDSFDVRKSFKTKRIPVNFKINSVVYKTGDCLYF